MRETIFSPDRKYRFTLWREWDIYPGYVNFLCLNPSTADETQDDPTIRRCIRFAKDWGYPAVCITNIFAYRATDPLEMKKQADPVGFDNVGHLIRIGGKAGMVIAAWGTHGVFNNQDINVRQAFHRAGINLHCLGVTNGGHPKHPLYLRADTKPQEFEILSRK
jgi:hypothetical protein